jgi:hypothetical protein
MSNVERGKHDPPSAVLVQSWCPKCGNGGKDPHEYFLNARGKEVWTKEGR